MAITDIGTPDEPEISPAELLRAFRGFSEQIRADVADFQRRIDAMAARASRIHSAEPLPPGLDEMPPMRGFLIDDSD